MKPLSCQKGFSLIIILIVIAVLIVGTIGGATYSPLRTQVEKITNNLEPKNDSTESGSKAEKESGLTQNPEDNIQTEISKKEKTSNESDQIINEDEENKAEGTGKKDEVEKDEKPEGVVDEPPVISTWKVLDFSKFYKPITLLLTPTPTPTPFINSNVVSNISRIKIPALITSSPTPAPTSTPKPTPAQPKKAIVVTLDTVKVAFAGDYPGNGEFQIVSSARTGSIEQVNAWPYKNWDEANGDNTLKIHQPIFILPEESMGDKLALWITVVENDTLPSSAPGLIKKATDISYGSKSIYQDPTELATDTLYNQIIDKYTKWLTLQEHFGTIARVYNKSDNYGLGSQNKKSFSVLKKVVYITYTIREVTIPEKPLKVDVTVKKIKTGKSAGDSIWVGFYPLESGDLYVWTNVFDGFLNKNSHGLTKRIPEKGEKKLGADMAWDINTNIFSGTVTGPVLYYEIGVWDKDDKSNDDQLEIVSDTLFMQDYKAGDVIKTSKDGDDGVDASATIEREIKFTAAD